MTVTTLRREQHVEVVLAVWLAILLEEVFLPQLNPAVKTCEAFKMPTFSQGRHQLAMNRFLADTAHSFSNGFHSISQGRLGCIWNGVDQVLEGVVSSNGFRRSVDSFEWRRDYWLRFAFECSCLFLHQSSSRNWLNFLSLLPFGYICMFHVILQISHQL